jgi:hypothetical protein
MKGQSFPHSAFSQSLSFPFTKKNNKSEKGKFEFSQFKSQSSFVVFLLIEFLKLIADTFCWENLVKLRLFKIQSFQICWTLSNENPLLTLIQ